MEERGISRGMPQRLVFCTSYYTSKDLSGCSMVSVMMSMGEALNRHGPQAFVSWIVPWRTGKLYWPEGFFDRPWIQALPYAWDDEEQMYDPLVGYEFVDPVLPRYGRHVFDYVLNQRSLWSAAWEHALHVPKQHRYWVPIETPVITWLTETWLDDRLPLLSRRSGKLQTLSSLMVSPLTIVMQPADKEAALDAIEPFVNEATYDECERKIKVLNPTADFDTIDDLFEEYEGRRTERRTRTGKVTVFHGGSLERKRKLDAGSGMIARLAYNGVPIAGRWVTQHTPTKNPFAEWDVPLLTGVGHDEYLNHLGDGDVLWAATEYEGTGLSYMEAIRSGMIPVVFLDKTRWMEPRLPEGYPFVTDRLEDMEPMLLKVVTSFDTIKAEWQEKLIRHLDRWQPDAVAGRYLQLVEPALAPSRERNLRTVRTVNPAFDLLAQAVEEEGWEEIDDPFVCWEAMTKRSRSGLDFRSWIHPLALRWMLIACGYEDRADKPGLSMRKVAADGYAQPAEAMSGTR